MTHVYYPWSTAISFLQCSGRVLIHLKLFYFFSPSFGFFGYLLFRSPFHVADDFIYVSDICPDSLPERLATSVLSPVAILRQASYRLVPISKSPTRCAGRSANFQAGPPSTTPKKAYILIFCTSSLVNTIVLNIEIVTRSFNKRLFTIGISAAPNGRRTTKTTS